jgi:hypothetical protein
MGKVIQFFVVIALFEINFLNAQSITNTLGTNGNFKVKDSSTDYLLLDQSSGNTTFYRNLELGGITNSTSTVGVITKSGQRFMHNYAAPGSFLSNTFIGIASGNFTLSANSYHNTAVGYYTLNQLTTGLQNSAFGFISLINNTEGNFNSAFGVSSLELNTTGTSNSAFGNFALRSNTVGNYNSAFGNGALQNNIASFNSAFGSFSLNSNISGNYNSAFGYNSLRSNTSGYSNSAIGIESLYSNTIGYYNCAIGFQSLYSNSSGHLNTAVGSGSLYFNSAGFYNSGFGVGSLYSNTTGFENSASGTYSLNSNTTGRENTAVGFKSLYSNVLGFQNTAVGDSALYKNTGNYNTAIGYNAGSNVTTGANLTLIGIDANPSTPTSIDQITLGNQFVQSLRCNVQMISSLSDERDKKNIKDLTLGLDFITKLKPRQFNWDRRDWYEDGKSDGSKMQKTPTAGFIAQEFDEIQNSENAEWLNLVLKDNPDKWEATYGNLLPVIVKAIQELKIENDSLRAQLEEEKELKEQLVEIKNLKEELIEEIKIIKTRDKNDLIKLTSELGAGKLK